MPEPIDDKTPDQLRKKLEEIKAVLDDPDMEKCHNRYIIFRLKEIMNDLYS
jgi:hypothetical protein